MDEFKLGGKIIRLEQVNSTNQFAKELTGHVSDIHEGTTVVGYDQLLGKGRHQKVWVSEKNKNLCLSIILFPFFLNASNIFMLSKAVSAGICDYLDKLNILDVKIKWPNDIFVGNHKIAGILIENSWKKNSIQESIIGIGLNVNQTHFPEMTTMPVSMKIIRKSEFDLELVLAGLLQSIEASYKLLLANDFEAVNSNYYEKLYRVNEKTTFMMGDEEIEGVILGVENDGKLKLETDKLGIKLFDLDEIGFKHETLRDY